MAVQAECQSQQGRYYRPTFQVAVQISAVPLLGYVVQSQLNPLAELSSLRALLGQQAALLRCSAHTLVLPLVLREVLWPEQGVLPVQPSVQAQKCMALVRALIQFAILALMRSGLELEL